VRRTGLRSSTVSRTPSSPTTSDCRIAAHGGETAGCKLLAGTAAVRTQSDRQKRKHAEHFKGKMLRVGDVGSEMNEVPAGKRRGSLQIRPADSRGRAFPCNERRGKEATSISGREPLEVVRRGKRPVIDVDHRAAGAERSRPSREVLEIDAES